MNEDQIRVELELLVKEIAVAKSLNEDNKSEVFSRMIDVERNNHPYFNKMMMTQKVSYYKWLIWNVFENQLPPIKLRIVFNCN